MPTTYSGVRSYSAISLAAVLAPLVQAGPTTLWGLRLFNVGANEVFVRLYDKATAPLSTDTPVWRGIVPGDAAGAGISIAFPQGLGFALGLGMRVSGAVADNDTTILAASEVVASAEYE